MTLFVIAGYLGGLFVAIERAELDFGFRRFNQVAADPRITLIDINDHALQQIGRWPWPRRLQADLVNVLHECGADAILLDLVYAEFQDPRLIDPALVEPDERYDPATEVLGELSRADIVHDDNELATAIARSGNVYVAMFFPLSPPAEDPLARRARARELLAADPDASELRFAATLGIKSRETAASLFLDARIDAVLLRDFRATAAELAAKLNVAESDIEERLARAKRRAARYLVERELAINPEASFEEVVELIVPDAASQRQSRDRTDLLYAYAHAKAAPFAFRNALPDAERFRGAVPCGGDYTLPIEPIAEAAKRVGFVNFEKDDDGVLRHVPPVAILAKHAVLQIAFCLAVDVLDIDRNSISIGDERAIELASHAGDRRWRLPLNGSGQLLLNWHIDRSEPVWNHSFAHIPVSRVMEIAANRRTMVANEDQLRAHRAEAVAFMLEGAESAYLDYEEAVRKLRESLLANEAEWAALRDEVEAIERRAIAHLQQLSSEIEGLQPQDDERALFERIQSLQKKVSTGETSEHIAELNATLRERNEQLLVELRERIAGKLCFVGHTAAAQADMVNTPVFDNMPGVMAHANFVNMMLTGRIPTVAPPSLNIAIILLSGLLATLLTSSRGPWAALVSVGALMSALLVISALLVYAQALFIAAWIPAGGVFVTWALITLYRQLTEQRQRRSFARELARNTSPAIAARITEQLDNLDLAPQPADVTCYFSDLQGFTTISERLGVEQTQTILNRYLAEMGEVLIAHRAFNKFMGDGIFAFFNAPIWPVEDHVVVGCDAALETRDRLAKLIAGAGPSLREVYGALRMRVGVHTGPVFVGYFGSEHQSDYTCIGDTVNLAARLESANKAFGTLMMVSGACREVAGDRYAYRHLGALQVKGKAQAVPVYELLGRPGEVEEADLRHAERFGRAVEAFQHRNWADARAAFDSCGTERPEDDAVRLYLNRVIAYEAAPPPDDWNQAIELTSK